MIDAIDPAVAGGAVVTASVAVAAAVRHYRKGGTVEADVDGDGDAEFTMSSPSNDVSTETYSGATDPFQSTQPTSPTPERVTDIGGDLAQITGVGPSRAEDLKGAGFETASDVYYAADENILAINGIGDHALGLIRDDIGGIDYQGNGESSDSTDDDSTSGSPTENSSPSPDATDGDGSSTDEAAA